MTLPEAVGVLHVMSQVILIYEVLKDEPRFDAFCNVLLYACSQLLQTTVPFWIMRKIV